MDTTFDPIQTSSNTYDGASNNHDYRVPYLFTMFYIHLIRVIYIHITLYIII